MSGERKNRKRREMRPRWGRRRGWKRVKVEAAKERNEREIRKNR